jgi:hypothetical protein
MNLVIIASSGTFFNSSLFLQPCLLKMESFFFLQNGVEEQLASSTLYQWMQITYQSLAALTLEK